MNVQFISSVAVITADPAQSRKLYVDVLGLPLKRHEGTEYFSSEEVAGSRHFGVWPLEEAAQACFGVREWPADRPVPQASIEFEVESVDAIAAAVRELEAGGHTMLHGARTEPWGQSVARLQSSEGVIVGVSYAPWMHKA